MFNPEPNPSIMKSLDNFSLIKAELETMPPDLVGENDLRSIPLVNESTDQYERNKDNRTRKSFLLMDKFEDLKDSCEESFCKRLGSEDHDKFKVVAIFGNTGDGKSHTLNHTFFNGEEVFKTSAESDSCTIGVYAALQRSMGVICIDTEGLLGTRESTNHHRRLRMLLKILAISDIVIYRTRSERLHADMYEFLGTASKAFCSHFSQALDSLDLPGTTQSLGPAVIIFHETRHTKPLESTVTESAEDTLRKEFARLNMDTKAFNSLRYIGINNSGPTNFSKLKEYIVSEIKNTSVRSPRQPALIFKAMQALNKKFSGEIDDEPINPFPEQYFTCTVICDSCNHRCQRSMGHIADGEKHYHSRACIYQHQYENKEYLCKSCYKNGRRLVVNIKSQNNGDSYWYGIAKYAWSGSVIECPNCGEIYRSRSYWYGNKTPEEIGIVRSEITHVWKGSVVAKGSVHSAQMVLDRVSYLNNALTSIGSQPTKLLSDWVADKVAPTYWRPNSEIKNCNLCKKNFEKLGLPKHHCRNCGEGFCNNCSSHKMPVPLRGWAEDVRVCNTCRTELLKNSKQDESNGANINHNINDQNSGVPEDADIKVRKYGETFYNTLTTVASVLEYPKEMIKDTARPSYWVPDSEGPNCKICSIPFGTAEDLLNTQSTSTTSRKFTGDCRRHHCRSCGENVCEDCSSNRRPVPERGWHTDVRVCDDCFIKHKTE